MYKNLEKEFTKRGYDFDMLSSLIGENKGLIESKFSGQSSFTLGEIKLIRDNMFPSLSLDYLFEEE